VRSRLLPTRRSQRKTPLLSNGGLWPFFFGLFGKICLAYVSKTAEGLRTAHGEPLIDDIVKNLFFGAMKETWFNRQSVFFMRQFVD